METPLPLIDSVVGRVCGVGVGQLISLAGGGMNETYRVELLDESAVVVRIARQSAPWFVDEAQLMALAGGVGVPTPQVLGLEQVDHDGELLSFSVQQFLPGRSLAELVGELPADDVERLVVEAGELLAQVHSITTHQGMRHDLRLPEESAVFGVARSVGEALGPAAAEAVERAAAFLREQVRAGRPAPSALVQGDFMPKNLLVDDAAIVGVIDWEFAGPSTPAFDLARWEVSAGEPFHDRSDLLRRGYARVADPDAAAAGLVPAFAIDWALEKLAWKNPATPEQVRRCVGVIVRYAGC